MPYRIVIENNVVIPQPLDPEESFFNTGTQAMDRVTVADFWQWAYSDLIGNTDRGALAEYLVGKLVGARGKVRNAWGPFDLEMADGTRVEVKSAGYAQAWFQREPSRVRFSIRKTQEWLPQSNEFVSVPARHSDVYVFCLLAEMRKEALNPLDLRQWEFYVVSTQDLDESFGDRAGVSLQQVQSRSARYQSSQLKDAIKSVRRL